MFTKSEKRWITAAAGVGLLFACTLPVGAMHIMEGYLPVGWAIGWGAVCLPFLAAGVITIRRRVNESHRNLILLALCGAFAFVLSALKIPSVSGSCSHPTGVGLGAVLFGPFIMSVIGVIVLLFQALLLSHGGLTTLGANTFSIGIVVPMVSFATYKICKKLGMKRGLAVFLAAFLGDLLTYVATSVQLSLAYPENGSVAASLGKFLGIFAVTQLPLAICEGLVTVVVFNVIAQYKADELKNLRVIE